MKKLFFFILLVICSFAGNAQQYLSYCYHHPSAIYITHQPVDFGIGIRGDYYINDVGFYSSASYGNWGLYRQYNLKHHIKITTGILFPLADYNGGVFDFTAGLNYHILKYSIIDNPSLNSKILKPLSFELGLTVKLRHFALGICTDIPRWEPGIDFGYAF
jgi:hypothetical protein